MIPRMPYRVRPIPMTTAPENTTAYTWRRQPMAAARATTTGYRYVNLYRPEVRPKGEMMALSLNEAVPGRHFQIARAGTLAYKIGQLKISELRARAERELGAKIDIREFNDAVLEIGSVPLTVLEARMVDWIARHRAG